MPSTKLPFFRYMLIDQMLRNKHKPYPTKDELLDACREKFGVNSASTIEKDICAMRIEFNAPILYNKRFNGYEYEDKTYKFLSVNLSERNLLALGFVETILGEFKEMPIFDEFSDAVDKVLDGLEITRQLGANARDFPRFIQIDKSLYSKGSELLSELITLITGERVAEMEYKKFGADKAKKYTIHPYLLKEYLNLWYLVGYIEEYKEVRVFGIDRIVQITPTGKNYTKASKIGFDPDTFYKYCIGVSALSEQPQKVVLHLTPSQTNYVKVRALHKTQRIVSEDETGCILEMDLIVNYELKMLLLEMGANVRVLAPEILVKTMREEAQKMLQNYVINGHYVHEKSP
jgi:predicted DNA-binding transcriptional regulator YafY